MQDQAGRATRNQGFSLLEVLGTLALLSLLASLGLPAFSHLIRDSRHASEAQQLLGLLQLARAEAQQRNRSVVLCKAGDSSGCRDEGDWQQGLLIFVDEDGDSRLDAGEALLRAELPLSTRSEIVGNTPVARRIRFNSLGRSSVSGTLTIGSPGVQRDRRAIVLSNTRSPRSCRPDRVPSDCP